jgi:prepilin-type N-terminal cleavage/methylation domain-containing protein
VEAQHALCPRTGLCARQRIESGERLVRQGALSYNTVVPAAIPGRPRRPITFTDTVMSVVRRAFTLIELLIVMVIIGALAAIAIPRFTRTKDRAYVATMMTDLKNLATAQSSYFSDFQTYTTVFPAGMYRPSTGVSVTISQATTTSWAANASHTSTTRTCTITYGGSGNSDGQPVCSN